MGTSEKFLSLSDFEEYARKKVPKYWFAFYSCGANDENTLRENVRAFQRYQIIPRILRDVSRRETGTTVLGYPISFPVCISPTAEHGQAHPDAEIGTARGVLSANTIYTQSTYSTLSIDKISCTVGDCIRFLQVQFLNLNDDLLRLVRLAEKWNYKALVLTSDDPTPGKRPSWERVANEMDNVPPFEFGNFQKHEFPSAENNYFCDASATWEKVKWLKSQTHLPIIVKGVISALDAELAIEAGASGILVSNHGGRQLDIVPATIDVLSDVVKAVNGRCEVYLDGGVRRGTDVFKAVALGARAVFIGRPVIYALATDGEQGVSRMLEILKEEFSITMALSGCASVEEIPSVEVRHNPSLGLSRL